MLEKALGEKKQTYIRDIQQETKKSFGLRKVKAVRLIERNYLLVKLNFLKLVNNLKQIKRNLVIIKIQKWFRLARKLKIINNTPLNPRQKQHLLQFYIAQTPQITLIQSCFRSYSVRKSLKFKKYLQQLRVQQQNQNKQEKQMRYYRTVRKLNSAQVQRQVQSELNEFTYQMQRFNQPESNEQKQVKQKKVITSKIDSGLNKNPKDK
eukprot:403359566